jgi:DNA-binding transcriptional MerR regulator
MTKNNRLFTIQQISRKTDLPKSTLRFWEKHFSTILRPIRSSGGQRRYTIEHISVLKEIKRLRDSGRSLAEIKARLEPDSESPLPCPPEFEMLAARLGQLVKDEIYRFYKLHADNR